MLPSFRVSRPLGVVPASCDAVFAASVDAPATATDAAAAPAGGSGLELRAASSRAMQFSMLFHQFIKLPDWNQWNVADLSYPFPPEQLQLCARKR